MRLVFFAPYPLDEAPSQRFRYEQYLGLLQGQGFKITLFSFYNQSAWKKLYTSRPTWRFIHLIKGLFMAFIRMPIAAKADYIFIHREIAPVGPPLLEWMLAKIFHRRIIYDFDDAIWLTDKINEGRIERIIRWRTKVASICRWSYKVSCGNAYLADYAKQFNTHVLLNPTTIDTKKTHNREFTRRTFHNEHRDDILSNTQIVIGWTGSHTTLKYLEGLASALVVIEQKFHEVSFLVIADKAPSLPLNRIEFRKWSKETEIEDLATIDIGIMPLPDDEWTKGKCGFKALQYMAMTIPALVSPVAVNKVIVQDGQNGFWCGDEQTWIDKLSLLIENEDLRKKMGEKGRLYVEQHYSVKSNTQNFLSLFS